jgi:mannosylfructose-phosphate synthase
VARRASNRQIIGEAKERRRRSAAALENPADFSCMDRSRLNSDSLLPRIAMVSTHGYVAAAPPLGAVDTGGQVVYVIELAKKLAELGFEVDIWTRRFEEQPEIDVINSRVRILRVPCGGPEFIRKEDLWEHMPEWSEHALRVIAEHQLSYEFVNSHYWDAGMAAELLCATLNVPHVHTPHSLGIWKQGQMERDFPQNRAAFEAQYNFSRRIMEERRLYGDCTVIIATTPLQFDLLASDYDVPTDKIRMLPPGYDDNRFYAVSEPSRQAIRKRLGFSGNAILALGRLARNKGYDLLIEAFAFTAARDPSAVLHLAIGGADMNARELAILAELRGLAEALGLSERVRFASFVPDKDLADYYRAADLFVLCSRYEPFGMTAIEAMACGTPTVVTMHGGLYRALSYGQHALFADPFDREDLGITLTKIFRIPQLQLRMSRMGALRVRSLFTWTGIAQQLLALVDDRSDSTQARDNREPSAHWEDTD